MPPPHYTYKGWNLFKAWPVINCKPTAAKPSEDDPIHRLQDCLRSGTAGGSSCPGSFPCWGPSFSTATFSCPLLSSHPQISNQAVTPHLPSGHQSQSPLDVSSSLWGTWHTMCPAAQPSTLKLETPLTTFASGEGLGYCLAGLEVHAGSLQTWEGGSQDFLRILTS